VVVILKYGAFLKYLDACGVACGGLLPLRLRAAARERRQGRQGRFPRGLPPYCIIINIIIINMKDNKNNNNNDNH